MNKRSFYPIAALLGAPLIASLSSCSDELGMNNAGKTINLTVTASKDANTRTYFEPEGRDLFSKWDDNDMIVVTNAAGKQVGVMTISAGAGNSTATFSGKVEYNGDETLNFLYLGNDSKAEATAEGYNISIASQISSIASLTDFDAMSKSAKIEVAGDEGTAEIGEMNRTLAFARFTLTNLELAAGDKVTVSGKNLRSSFTLTSKGEVIKANTDGSISVTIPEDATNANDIYMAVLPLDNDSITPTFTVSKNGKTYKGSLKARLWTQSEYVNVSATEGVEVAMEEYNDPYAGYENEDPRNPLHIFAKYNLTRKGDATAWENVFADSETENGALYQWGRNYGYMDTKGIYANSNTGFDPGDDFTNYMDAMGSITYDWDNYSSRVDYYVYDNSRNGVVSGTGCHINNNTRWEDGPYTYSSAEDIKAHPTKYFMDARTSGRTEDYWLSSFGDGGKTWEDRAKNCGYSETNPCPKGWRIPTEEEYRSIMPQTNIEKNKVSLTELLNTTGAQLREYNSIRYVIRWVNLSNYIEIQALVVDNDFKESEISTITWDSNTNVVRRKFPYTGHIDNLFGYEYYTGVYYARPYGRYRKVDEGIWIVNKGHDGLIYPDQQYLMIGPASPNYGFCYGAYWISDGTKAMKFSDRQSFESSSYYEIGASGAAMGFAIRPVMDK